MYVDLAEYTADYVNTIDDLPTDRKQLAQQIAVAWCDGNPDLADLDEAAFLDTAHNSIAPQIEYYLA